MYSLFIIFLNLRGFHSQKLISLEKSLHPERCTAREWGVGTKFPLDMRKPRFMRLQDASPSGTSEKAGTRTLAPPNAL